MTDKKSHGRSKAGVELTEEVLDQMAKEAEEGLDTTKAASPFRSASDGVTPSGITAGAPRPETPEGAR